MVRDGRVLEDSAAQHSVLRSFLAVEMKGPCGHQGEAARRSRIHLLGLAVSIQAEAAFSGAFRSALDWARW